MTLSDHIPDVSRAAQPSPIAPGVPLPPVLTKEEVALLAVLMSRLSSRIKDLKHDLYEQAISGDVKTKLTRLLVVSRTGTGGVPLPTTVDAAREVVEPSIIQLAPRPLEKEETMDQVLEDLFLHDTDLAKGFFLLLKSVFLMGGVGSVAQVKVKEDPTLFDRSTAEEIVKGILAEAAQTRPDLSEDPEKTARAAADEIFHTKVVNWPEKDAGRLLAQLLGLVGPQMETEAEKGAKDVAREAYEASVRDLLTHREVLDRRRKHLELLKTEKEKKAKLGKDYVPPKGEQLMAQSGLDPNGNLPMEGGRGVM